MGAGKSFLLNSIEAPDWIKFELDHVIEGAEMSSIPQIFEEKGEKRFRKLELEHLHSLLRLNGNLLISLGGGALSDQALELINEENGILVWLDVPFETCLSRIDGDSNRPLLKQGEAKLLKLYKSRLKNYAKSQLQLGESDIIKLRTIDDLLQRISDKS